MVRVLTTTDTDHRLPKIFTVIDARYMRLGLAWARCAQEVSGRAPTFICADEVSCAFLQAEGFACLFRPPPVPLSPAGRQIYAASTFPNDAAAYTVTLKLAAALDFLDGGDAVLFSDVDAIWLKDPVGDILRQDADIVFQPASFPKAAKDRWGFAICTGFLFLRPCQATRQLAEAVIRRFDGSDQRTLNHVLLADFDIGWLRGQPTGRPAASRVAGSTPSPDFAPAPVGAWSRCPMSALSVTALVREPAAICHSNSPKDQEEKFRILDALGIALPRGP